MPVKLHARDLNLGLLLLLAAIAVASIMIGVQPIEWSALIAGSDEPLHQAQRLIVYQIRIPRTLIALLTGANLGLCGALMQALMRNPLAEPGLIGSSSGAALAAVIALYFGLSASLPNLLPLAGIFGALVATLLVYMLAGRQAQTLTLILAGIAVNSFVIALISMLLNLAPNPYAVQEIALWMLGSVANSRMTDVWLLLPGSLIAWALIFRVRRSLDALTLGEDSARSMGVHLARLQWASFIAIALAVGSSVAITGSIGFIGLVAPHLIRRLMGYQPSRTLLSSALTGGILLLAADIVTRLLPLNTDIKAGVITALIGAPFFLALIINSRKTSV